LPSSASTRGAQRREVALQRVDIDAQPRQLLLEGLRQSLQGLHRFVELLQLLNLVAQLTNLALQFRGIARLRLGCRTLLKRSESSIQCAESLIDVAVGARNRLRKLSTGHGAIRAEGTIRVALKDAQLHQLLNRLIRPVPRRDIPHLGEGQARNQAQTSHTHQQTLHRSILLRELDSKDDPEAFREEARSAVPRFPEAHSLAHSESPSRYIIPTACQKSQVAEFASRRRQPMGN
jgi:hypothetical protein